MAIAVKKQSWLDFEKWCVLRGLCPAPANPWTLCAYIRVIEKTMTIVALKRHISHIGVMHFEKLRKRPDRDPMVKNMLQSIEEHVEDAKAKKAVPVLFDAEDFLDAASPKPKPKKKPANKADKKRGLSTEPKLVRRKKV